MAEYIPQNALAFFSHALNAEPIQGLTSGKPTLLVELKVNKNKPEYSTVNFKVIHRIQGEQNKSFDATMPLKDAMAALKAMDTFANRTSYEDGLLYVDEIKAPKMINGKPSQERVTQARLVVGLKERGPFISIVHWNDKYPKIVFYPGDVNEMNAVCASKGDAKKEFLYHCNKARGWAETISSLITTEYSYHVNKVLDEKRANGGSDNGGSNGYSSGGGNSYQQQNNSSTDDFPF